MENNSGNTVARTATLPTLLRLEILLPVAGFVLPLILSGPQVVVGTLVNALIFFYAIRVPTGRTIVMCALPSLGAICHGVVFGAMTPYVFYFFPSIVLGNMILVKTVRVLGSHHWIVMIIGSGIAKAALLFITAYVFVLARLVPGYFLAAMGVVQLGTALTGGILAVLGIRKRTCRN